MRHNHNYRIDEFDNAEYIHKPILWREIAGFIKDSGTKGQGHLADCTLGEGGHGEILLKLFSGLTVTGVERDAEILEIAGKRLAVFGSRVSFVHGNFSSVSEYFQDDIKPDYILFDFGISSYHFDKSGRGFTFSSDEPLDMRLDAVGPDAWHVINRYPQKELERVFRELGEEKWAAHIAKIVVERRAVHSIDTSAGLASVVLAAIPKKFHVKNIHPATRVFQGVRIEVNRELDAIAGGLGSGFSVLAEGGLMMAISFHSLEDRIVKNFFRRMKSGCLCGREPQHCICSNRPFGEVLTKKPVEPRDDEVVWNNRSRSAKLRVIRKLRDVI